MANSRTSTRKKFARMETTSLPAVKAKPSGPPQSFRYRFLLWRKTRPFWGGLWLTIAGVLVLLGPLNVLQFALFPGSLIWAGLLVGALLVVMGLILLLVPSLAVIAGAIGIVLSLVSLLVALGGFGIGMLLGVLGGALGVAWRPAVRRAPSIWSRFRSKKSGA